MVGTMLGAGTASTVLSAGRSAISNQAIPHDLHDYDFFMARVKFDSDKRAGDGWNIQPAGDNYLLEELGKAVRCRVKLIPGLRRSRPGGGSVNHFNAVVDLNYNDGLHKLPFLFMTAGGHFSFNDAQKQNFKNYVEQGGFILMDDCVAHGPGDFFYHSSCQLLEHLFGKAAVEEISTGHEIFHNVYDLSQIGIPYVQGTQWPPRGIFIEDRLAVLVTSTDIHCGWADRTQTWFGPNVTRRFGGRGIHGYNESIKMGINLIMYVLSH
jgi:hypothetical protein